jgi:hypothetical protein
MRNKYATAQDFIKRMKVLWPLVHGKHLLKSEYMTHAFHAYAKDKETLRPIGTFFYLLFFLFSLVESETIFLILIYRKPFRKAICYQGVV